MSRLFQIIMLIIIVIVIITGSYFVFFSEEDNENGNGNGNGNGNHSEPSDTDPPEILSVTGDVTVTAGNTVRIEATFQDNEGVTTADLVYKKSTDTTWEAISILDGDAVIPIPAGSIENRFYYILIDDAAGNGPVGDPSTDGSTYYTITVEEEHNNNNSTDDHIVFIEEGTAKWCSNCPIVSEALHNLFNPDDPDFYYVSLVEDKNPKAKQRLEDDYNIYGFPTTFLDGGYELIVGSSNFEEKFQTALSKTQNRQVPDLDMTLLALWNDTRKELITTVDIQNNEETTYEGRIRIYINEIQSRWTDHDGNPYTYAFLDFAGNQDISIPPGENISINKLWVADAAGYGDVYPENLYIIAVVFNAEYTLKFSDPPDNTKSFEAHYADIAVGKRISEGVLPPTIGISQPRSGYRYLLGTERARTRFGMTMVIGRIMFKAIAEAEAGVEKVEFYIDGELVNTDTEAPYEYEVGKINAIRRFFKSRTFKVILYDNDGRTAEDSVDLFTILI